jgi:hypothetical protein
MPAAGIHFTNQRTRRNVMGSLQVQVNPPNSGDVTVRVWIPQRPLTGTPIDQTFTVNSANPLDQTWKLDPGLYSVTISWKNGYQNIASGVAGNMILVNGASQYYQVLGTPADGNGVMATFGYQV